jgi:hypothetical protein
VLIIGFVFESLLVVWTIYFLALKKYALKKLSNYSIDAISFLYKRLALRTPIWEWQVVVTLTTDHMLAFTILLAW